jgi:hypothetical protein
MVRLPLKNRRWQLYCGIIGKLTESRETERNQRWAACFFLASQTGIGKTTAAATLYPPQRPEPGVPQGFLERFNRFPI